MTTFDGLYYHMYTSGNFIYVRNLSYVPIEVSPPSDKCTMPRLDFALRVYRVFGRIEQKNF